MGLRSHGWGAGCGTKWSWVGDRCGTQWSWVGDRCGTQESWVGDRVWDLMVMGRG